MAHCECAVGAKRTGIKGTSFTGLTPIVGDGMKVGGWVLPGDGNARSNVDEFWRIIRRERAKGNSKGRWACHCKRTYQKQTDHQENNPSSFQCPKPTISFLLHYLVNLILRL